MTPVLWFLVALGSLGAADTLYFHEWRCRLPALGRAAAPELKLHAARDFTYAAIFGTLPWLEWRGLLTALLVLILLAEVVITLADFVVEDRVRRPLGGVLPGERVMHAVMGIVYGAMLPFLAPSLVRWAGLPTALAPHEVAAPAPLRLVLAGMAAGVLVSGVRDLCAALEIGPAGWPWTRAAPDRG